MSKPTPPAGNCPVHYAMSHFGDKWSLLVIRDLMFFGKRYYSEFLNSGEGISTNILANRLRQLEQEGIIRKSRDRENKTRYLYELTEKGLDLMPVMLELVNWSAKYDQQTAAPPDFIRRFSQDKQKMQEVLLAKYEAGESIFG